MYIHRASCPYNYATTEEAFEVDKILDVFGRKGARWFLVKYVGYEEPEWKKQRIRKLQKAVELELHGNIGAVSAHTYAARCSHLT